MSDKPSTPATARASSVPAIVTFWLLLIWSGQNAGLFAMTVYKIELNAVLSGILQNVLGTTGTLLVAAVSFWVGSTVGARASGDALAESNKAASTALSTLAGAPPIKPSDPASPAPVVVTNDPTNPVPTTTEEPRP
jgi:hypothetical protein